jgi:DNA-binding transcriptional ArsR family regulator
MGWSPFPEGFSVRSGLMIPHEVFAALADPTRLEVLSRLADGGPATATELSSAMPISRQAVTKHLAALDAAGLVERHPAGREVRYTFDPEPLGDLVRWVEKVGDTWDRRLGRLSRSVE